MVQADVSATETNVLHDVGHAGESVHCCLSKFHLQHQTLSESVS